MWFAGPKKEFKNWIRTRLLTLYEKLSMTPVTLAGACTTFLKKLCLILIVLSDTYCSFCTAGSSDGSV